MYYNTYGGPRIFEGKQILCIQWYRKGKEVTLQIMWSLVLLCSSTLKDGSFQIPGLLKMPLISAGFLEFTLIKWIKDAIIFHFM